MCLWFENFASCFMQAAAMLHDCGLVHGDLGVHNCMVRMAYDGRDVHLAVIDFGSCEAAGTCKHTSAVASTAMPVLLFAFLVSANALSCGHVPCAAYHRDVCLCQQLSLQQSVSSQWKCTSPAW